MKRRQLLTCMLGLGAVSVAGVRSARAKTPTMLWLHDTRIAGSHYYRFGEVASVIRPGHRLQLRAQPENRYDQNAVEVYWQGAKLGYLPRVDNTASASLLSRGHVLEARVLEKLDPERTWEPLTIRVWMRSPSMFEITEPKGAA